MLPLLLVKIALQKGRAVGSIYDGIKLIFSDQGLLIATREVKSRNDPDLPRGSDPNFPIRAPRPQRGHLIVADVKDNEN
jgi:hypothetical protein